MLTYKLFIFYSLNWYGRLKMARLQQIEHLNILSFKVYCIFALCK